MFFVNLKLSNKRIAIIFVTIVAAAMLVIFLRLKFLSKPRESSIQCSTQSEVREYLLSFGLELGDCSVDDITVPFDFNDVYKNYNKIQISQGFNLANYKGKQLNRFTFSLQNHPHGDKVFAEVLIYEKQIVGADIYSTDLEGFMAPLK